MHGILRTSSFADKSVRDNAIGAGILPVSRNESGDVVFLLAKEQHVPYWRGSYKWSAFEGGRHESETVEECSGREWFEESMGVIAPIDVDFLMRNEYVCRFTLNVMHNRRASALDADRYHVTYAVEIPFGAHHADAFGHARKRLLRLKSISDNMQRLWAQIIDGNVRQVEDAADHFVIRSDTGMIQFQRPYPDALDELISLVRDAEAILEDAKEGGVPGAVPQRTSSGFLCRLTINADYLEKERVRWWTLPELQQVLQNGGKFHDECFRTYFLPVLEGMVEFFSKFQTDARRDVPPVVAAWDGMSIVHRAQRTP